MRKKLSVIGNGLGIVIEKPILDLLKIDRDTELDVTIDGRRLILQPFESEKHKRFDETAKRILKKHSGTFRKLAK
jgi:antitoxin MazE